MKGYPRCQTCRRLKKPVGRDMPAASTDWCYFYGYVDGEPDGCEGYYDHPFPVGKWPNEIAEQESEC